jgi:hypothetical protein
MDAKRRAQTLEYAPEFMAAPPQRFRPHLSCLKNGMGDCRAGDNPCRILEVIRRDNHWVFARPKRIRHGQQSTGSKNGREGTRTPDLTDVNRSDSKTRIRRF